jgi:hypothetical protein
MRFPSLESLLRYNGGCPQEGVFLPSQMEFYSTDKDSLTINY